MKSAVLSTIVTVGLGAFLTGGAFAQEAEKAKQETRAQDQAKSQTQEQVKTAQQLQAGQPAGNQTIQHGRGFVDLNGDGYNDNAPDHDGDGIPNGLDPDYTGSKMHNGNGPHAFIDLDGDGINDNSVRAGNGMGKAGNTSGKHGLRGRSATAPAAATGVCDGTGPKGKGKGRGK